MQTFFIVIVAIVLTILFFTSDWMKNEEYEQWKQQQKELDLIQKAIDKNKNK